jgi:DNA polymerase-3 subunit delta
MPYPEFQRLVVPALLAHDARLTEIVHSWRNAPPEGKGKRSAKSDTDLALVKNPKSVYPVYQLFLQAEGFTAAHLQAVRHRLTEADRSLKSSAAPARWIIEALLWFICQGGDPGSMSGEAAQRPRRAAPSRSPGR